ncbi:MAG: hypothetical protein PHP06_09630 [Clostridia bacterium]|nr:hypothetical protein [Clostridia bacterium]
MQTWHKITLVVILLVSLVAALFLASNYHEFFYDLSMTIFTSIFLFLLIDNIIEKYSQKEEEKKLKVTIERIIPTINKFYNYFVDLYAGTAENTVSEDDPVLKNIFHEKEELYRSIVKNLNRKEKSPYLDIDRFTTKDFFAKKPLSYLTWEQVWLNHYSSLHQDLLVFQMYNGAFLSAELLSSLEELIGILNDLALMRRNMEKLDMNKINIMNEEDTTFYNMIKLKEIMASFEAFLICIKKETKVDLMSVKIQDINNRKQHPLLGELLKCYFK